MPVEVYFDHRIEGESNSALKTHLAWSKSSSAHLAVASHDAEKGGTVNLYQDDGTAASNTGFKPASQVSAMTWHPSLKYLAVGWQNGELSIWNDTDNQMYENADAHKQSVSILQWNDSGTVLVSSDARGLCLGWKLDGQGGLSLLFTQELKDVVTDIVFRGVTGFGPMENVNRLAKAAVDGDEKALNIFASWTSHSEARRYRNLSNSKMDSASFYVGTVSGMVFFISDNGSCNDVLQMEGSIQRLMHNVHRDMLIIVTEMLALAQFRINEDGSLTEFSKVKLSGRVSDISIIWAGKGVLAVSTGEQVVRLWTLESGHNVVLQVPGESWESITCLAYDAFKDVLAAGTNQGRVVMWTHMPPEDKVIDREDESQWCYHPLLQVRGAVKNLDWGTGQRLLGVLTATDVYIISQQGMCYTFKDQVAALQVSARQIAVELLASNSTADLRSDVPVRGIHVNVDHVAVSNGRQLHIYEIPADGKALRFVGSFNSESTSIVLYEQSAFTIDNGKIEVRTFQGTIKQTLNFSEEEGEPVCMDQCGNFLVVGTEKGFLRIWDISHREAKPHAGPKLLMSSSLQPDSKIDSVKCNCKGNKVSIIVKRLSSRGQVETDSSLYVWDVENDSIVPCDFADFRGFRNSMVSKLDNEDVSSVVKDRFPVGHFWDPEDPRLLVCEAKLLESSQHLTNAPRNAFLKLSSYKPNKEQKTEMLIVSLFVTSEHGILIQDTCPIDSKKFKLIGVRIPYYYLIITNPTAVGQNQESKGVNQDDNSKAKPDTDVNLFPENMKLLGTSQFVAQQTMRDFIGLESCDKVTKEAIITFSFFLTTGNMDEAFKSIKVIKNESVWENMARMCVKTKKLDVASVCLGKMAHARGARALRLVVDEPEIDARVAVLALQLGMVDEAEQLLKSCKRYDMLNQLYQDTGQWLRALEVAEENDRVHLRNTYYNYAKYLESKGDISGAIPLYEKSETHHFEVPRMLFDEPSSLESYIVKSRDKELHKWWAQYMESIGEMELALQFYEAAQDYLSLVRVYCYCNNLEKAAEIANETGDRAACFHLGRQFENQDNVKEAIHFFTRAHAYNNAIRICKEHGMEDQLLNLALVSGPQEMLEVATYYENKHGHQDKSIMLYHKAGFVTKAVELALKTKEYGSLQTIASELNEKSDPHILQYCAQFFLENKQYDKAVDLLATAKKYMEALELCLEHNVPMTEQLAEKLTVSKSEGDSKLRATVLEKIGEICMLQDDFHLAAKKFTQAGNKVQAMKALLKSGDTEKIVFFAGVSRQREIYIMAANYLQSLDWRQDADIMKNIIGFYTKGKALDLLAGFYDACAQVEIDEYQNYEKALGALNEALKCLTKQQNSSNANASQIEKRIAELKWKMELVKKFVQARRLYADMPEESVKQCQTLLDENSIETAVRRGDIYAFLVEHQVQQGNYKAAYELIEDMQAKIPGVNLPYYISIDALKAIYRNLDIQPSSGGQTPFFTEQRNKMWEKGGGGEDNNADYAEEVVEEPENDELGQ